MRILVLTGAGVSAESGLGTFRDAGGVWTKHNPLELATPEAFARDPDRVQDFYNQRRRDLLKAQPNAAHRALARLQEALAAMGGRLDLVTQNVDDLHERGGSRDVLHMHGELLKARCTVCGAVHIWTSDILRDSVCDRCLVKSVQSPDTQRLHTMRPHIVWFGEVPFFYDEIFDAIDACDLFVAIGTSGTVQPAAGLVEEVRGRGGVSLELNLAASETADRFTSARYGPATQIVPAWVEEVIAGLKLA